MSAGVMEQGAGSSEQGAEAFFAMPVALMERLLTAMERLTGVIAGNGSRPAVPDSPIEGGVLMTKQQVAAVFGGKCSVRRIERMMASGRLKKVPNLGRRTVRFRPADVARLLAEEGQRRHGQRRC